MKTKTRIIILAIILIMAVLFFATKSIFSKSNTYITDINNDGITDTIDVNILKLHFNEKCSFWQSCPTDINHDGVTDINDFNILIGQYGKKTK